MRLLLIVAIVCALVSCSGSTQQSSTNGPNQWIMTVSHDRGSSWDDNRLLNREKDIEVPTKSKWVCTLTAPTLYNKGIGDWMAERRNLICNMPNTTLKSASVLTCLYSTSNTIPSIYSLVLKDGDDIADIILIGCVGPRDSIK